MWLEHKERVMIPTYSCYSLDSDKAWTFELLTRWYLCRDVRLTLVHQSLVQRNLARTEEDDQQDLQLSYQQISPLDHVGINLVDLL